MPDRTTVDSPTLEPLQAPGPEAPSRDDGDAQTTAHVKPAPARKARRPRPTFDDGALTRTFKFPSKAYPRSSYYVTSTEIIIRIKKARKKWKLIVPKKRLVSYRTNRWFAKPRWVAIELTYTQAVKLGLAEARPRAPDAAPEIVASDPASSVHAESTDIGASSAAPSPADLEVAGPGELLEPHNELADQINALDEQDGADDFQVAADQGEPEVEEPEPEPEPEPSPPVSLAEAPQPDAAAATHAKDGARVVPFVARRHQPLAAPRRRGVGNAIVTLAAAVTGFAIWAAFDATPVNPDRECVRAEHPAARCADPIVTGSISPGDSPQRPAAAPVEDPPSSVTQVAANAPAEPAAANLAASPPLPAVDDEPGAALPAETSGDAREVVLSGRDIALPLSLPVFTSPEPPPQPVATVFAECDSLGAAGRQIPIVFDYGRAHLEPAVLAALSEFAAKLKACPASKVTIEGHTDSDGRADRNRSLSLRRAQAVHKHLVAAGVDPEQLAAVGFGQTRPAVPNISQQNKRSNRRAALVVTTQR